jgi:hypothetical protein
MLFDLERVKANLRKATTEELLDRVTVERAGIEPQVLPLIEEELSRRGVRPDQIEQQAQKRQGEVITLADGTPARCSFCRKFAVEQGRGWQRLWGVVPVFRRYFYYCEDHRPRR